VSAFSETRRAEVTSRAGHQGEYCRLPTRGQVATFPIDHVIPRSRNGTNDLDNLALTCPHCNAHKWNEIEAPDNSTGEISRFFNPRKDVWIEHFEWSTTNSWELIGLTSVGRATIDAFRINDADMIALRVLLAEVGVIRKDVV
jgi:hypothetical protein